ncbi:MAG: redoxin domain-containing protein [Bacteroidales bacterium]|nr:redoxin domain-containing protein [Bacteroidales bacterium]MBR3493463.1 redoxin domain-containing protein [Bacteroidales bacterium]MBR6930661.1 redoxin domain-containing protein [Bacteroidales bacterium]
MKSKLFTLLLLLVSSLGWGWAQNAHFWDGIEDFDGPTDENPILAAQIDFYFDKMVAPLPDSITLEISRLIEKTENNTDLRDFILWHLLERYRYPEYMSQDQVFVWLYDQYCSQLEIKDLNETNLALIQEKAERLRRLALFNVAPDIKLGDSIDLQSIENNFTVLFFYDHDCDLCQQEMQDLDSVVAQHPEITKLAIDMNTDDVQVDVLYDLYDIETTPLIYVLDRDKRIIAKKIRARQIPLMIQ